MTAFHNPQFLLKYSTLDNPNLSTISEIFTKARIFVLWWHFIYFWGNLVFKVQVQKNTNFFGKNMSDFWNHKIERKKSITSKHGPFQLR
jgi:hypothetical protein